MNENQLEEISKTLKDIKDILFHYAKAQTELANLRIRWTNKKNEEEAERVRRREEFVNKRSEYVPVILEYIKNNEGCSKKDIIKAFLGKIGSRHVGNVVKELKESMDITVRGRPQRFYKPIEIESILEQGTFVEPNNS